MITPNYVFMKHTLLLLSCTALLLIGFSCKKGDKGDPGPAGTANVFYSAWFTPSAYTKDTVFSIWGFNYNKTAPQITQQVLDSGTVLTFGKLLGYNPSVWPATQVSQLPITLTYNSGGTTRDTWSALLSPGNLRIRMINDRNVYGSIAVLHQFRYIIIPGGQPLARIAALSYEEVCKKYNIPE